jgi:hypothetical protein
MGSSGEDELEGENEGQIHERKEGRKEREDDVER